MNEEYNYRLVQVKVVGGHGPLRVCGPLRVGGPLAKLRRTFPPSRRLGDAAVRVVRHSCSCSGSTCAFWSMGVRDA